MTIFEASEAYESWLGSQMPLIEPDIEFKHEQMSASEFSFFRATYYRWAQRWEKVCDKVAVAPEVLSVGDLHVENFGTWRDMEGRLVWGINDFDEVTTLPYTNDLVRLAASVAVAIKEERLALDLHEACEGILAGYEKGMETGGRPFVLEEHHPELRHMATNSLRDPQRFWERLNGLELASGAGLDLAIDAMESLLPRDLCSPSVRARRAGLGSLGRPRYVFIAEHEGGLIAREAKHMAGSAVLWAKNKKPPYAMGYEAILARAVRCNDPLVKVSGKWLVRRLAPHCTRISLSDWPEERQEINLVKAMGHETANVHLGTRAVSVEILDDLKKRPEKWLRKAAAAMAEAVQEDAVAWRQKVRS